MNGPPDPPADDWGPSPCGLLRIDRDGVISAVNRRFLERTGYRRAELIGRMRWSDLLTVGSRLFLETQLLPILTLDGVLEEVMIDVLAADGRRLPALMSAATATDSDGRPAGARLALMTVPDRRQYEDELRRARTQAEQANLASSEARDRLELSVRANTALAGSVNVEDAFGQLARVLVPQLADWCLIYGTDPNQPGPAQWSAAHADPARQALLERLAALLPEHSSSRSALFQVLHTGKGVLIGQVTEAHLRESTDSRDVLELYAALGMSSALVVPSQARGQRVAAILLVRGPDRAVFTDADLSDLSDLGARTGIVIDNLRRYARERSNSMALQHALLTAPPATDQFAIVSRYLPAADGAEVGGDWYDAFAQPDGSLMLVIGDVVGHDIHAAAAMGQLRGVIRSIAHAIPGTPAETLARAERAARSLGVSVLASTIVARIESSADATIDRRTLRWSIAGHPPLVLITSRGDIRLLDGRPDPLLGISVSYERHDHVLELSPGDTLLLYTDGLIERPDEDLDLGVARLVAALEGGQTRGLDELCDLVLEDSGSRRRDDIALLAVRVLQ